MQLEVSDTGCGMTEEAKTKIFDPFYTTKFVGRGMGLAVVQGIVQDHGGAIHVISAPGQGATFQIFLPCANPLVAQTCKTEVSAKAEHPSGPTGTVLLVEDEDASRGLGEDASQARLSCSRSK